MQGSTTLLTPELHINWKIIYIALSAVAVAQSNKEVKKMRPTNKFCMQKIDIYPYTPYDFK